MSMRSASERITDSNHPIKEVKDRLSSIYIGKIVNKQKNKSDVLLVERLLTTYVHKEFPNYDFNSDNFNMTNYSKPKFDVYIINEWRNQDTDIRHKRNEAHSTVQLIPDIMVYDQEEDSVRGWLHLKEIIRY